ncbi:acyl carrier protein [Epilithonimonas xixisoli]|uniref:Acyl carrier protein n=1 Tax=Epilithonimonas xixisoli TaxID=1476462 RepID=A0A4R8I708_9FLAO|nr:phosphopantetheine-binding protein [Epilithonimonas xixisoli]TDX84195.1 acyl carrier protein [Epilithonimonas xixisoli]
MQEKLLTIINSIKKNKFEEEVLELKPEQKLREDLNFDSFDLAELTVKIEEEFEVDIFEDGLVNTVEEIYTKLQCFS